MQTKNKSVVLLRRKLNYLVLFGLAVMGVCLYTLNFAITQKFGEITAQYTIFGALAICFGWGLLVSLLSAPILTSQFTGVIDRIKALKESRSKLVGLGYRKQDLIDSQIHDTEVAEKSVTEASRAMKVAIDKVLIATESTINAFMAGIGSRVVVFYGGLIDKLSPEAIRGVAYHEVAHAMNNDIFLTLFTLSFVNAFMFLGAICWEITKFLARWGWWFMTDEDKENGGRKINASKITGGITAGAVGGSAAAKFIAQFLNSDIVVFGFFALVFWFVSKVVGQMVSSLISQNRELLADATAIEYGAGQDMVTALQELRDVPHASANPEANSRIVASLGITPANSSFSLSTHPSTQHRIRNGQNIIADKLASSAGQGIHMVLSLITAFLLGWTITFHLESVPMVLGIPTAFIGLIYFISSKINSLVGEEGPSVPNKDEVEKMSDDEKGLTALKLIGQIVLLLGLWIFFQVSFYHTFALSTFATIFGLEMVSWLATLIKDKFSLGAAFLKLSQIANVVVLGYFLYQMIF
ncbi:TPA: hypothetical protein DIU27_00970 [Candidatus Collierbacteria bacterium]|uniref:Peptidase M48 domain-containing protein n=1 Tax=Candidatus Collierbacteria bacterium GW2011_GWB2_44_22 TaxID=1618387 RepID=A0A0G1HY43_9BACT|nr:MAG: hypothetical protein UW31_C0010G0034 [Candidatus Collierbacteria bacterium GW2011_GWA2_44_13]KKT52061.1 MAG: hypothetical protein UW44_C0005G0103 [Candidatus Collierbacteria bacterium GW2011_GWB2_44_22]KKT62608.1 MAG: hypothetical protein UW56_C0005G0044 [Candidatus Collierbacteria bacterium GW2011_GWD1_44_27]KKT66016.1 MAG: hypothetical protein UW58_C0014G0003 [Candidatus Collierbacteria bacterium GW2011_GWC2_44_30]KKT68065.1 MAG: hypothetical protein UW64_C0030G0013 [Microgenomates gr